MKVISYLCGISLFLLFSCSKKPPIIQVDKMFTLLPNDYTHLKFENKLVTETDFNVFKYRNYYNGGSVAFGDVNNDGLPDVYMIAEVHYGIKTCISTSYLRCKILHTMQDLTLS